MTEVRLGMESRFVKEAGDTVESYEWSEKF